MDDTNLKALFDYHRIYRAMSLGETILFIIYIPLGVFLIFLRSVVLAIWFLIFMILPTCQKNKIRFCRGFCIIVGLIYKSSGEPTEDFRMPRLIVSNHSYTLEMLPFMARHWCMITPRHGVTQHFMLKLAGKLLDTLPVDDFVKEYKNFKDYRILIFPEGATTNGRVGLLKYNPLIFFCGEPILPIATKLSRPFPIALCKLQFAMFIDFIWLLFVPWTICNYNFLTTVTIKQGELPTEFADRVQQMSADKLGLLATQYTVDDKTRLRKIT